MARLCFTTHTLVLNAPLLFKIYTFIYLTNIFLHSFIPTFIFTIPVAQSNTENYLPSDDPDITNHIVFHYDCEKQHNLRQFNLINVKQGLEAP